jgi:hypothetical protein
MAKDIGAATFDELIANPEAYGLPTFDQFAKNTEKYTGRDDDMFAEAEAGSRNLDRHVQRHIYEIEGYRCKSLHEVERIAKAQGIPLRELEYKPQVIPQGAGKCDLLVKFVPKNQADKRKLWG